MTDPVPDLSKIRTDVPPALAAVVSKALAKDRNDRFATGNEFAAALRDSGKAGAAVPVYAATVVDLAPAFPDPASTVVEPLADEPSHGTAGMAAATGAAAAAAMGTGSSTAAPAAAPAAPAPTPTAPPPRKSSGGSRGLLYGVGAAILLLLIAIGVWAVFIRDTGEGEDVAGVGEIATETVEPTDESPDLEATQAALDAIVETRLAESAVGTTVAIPDLPTDTPEPTATPTVEPTEAVDNGQPIVETDATLDWARGEALVLSETGERVPLTADTLIMEGTEFFTGADGELLFTLDDGSAVQIGPNSNVRLKNVGDDPTDYTQQTIFTLIEGDIFLQKPQVGNELAVFDSNEYLLALLQTSDFGSIESRSSAGKRLLQGANAAAMSVNYDGRWATVACFAGSCKTGTSETPLSTGWEKVITTQGGLINTYVISTDTASYQQWQTACEGCLAQAPAPVRPTDTPVPPTSTKAPPTVTATVFAPTATTVAPTQEPTKEAGGDMFVQITGITLENGVYIVSYATSGYTEQLPGQHVHFYFDTVSESNAGSPGSGPWKLYGGPRPFTQYTEGDRPGGASSMCARVANPDHSIIFGSGNCYPLP
jgi:hypothetical protein